MTTPTAQGPRSRDEFEATMRNIQETSDFIDYLQSETEAPRRRAEFYVVGKYLPPLSDREVWDALPLAPVVQLMPRSAPRPRKGRVAKKQG